MQVTLKRDNIYKIENTDLEIGVSGVLLPILFYFEARRCSRQTDSLYALRINLSNIMIQRTLLRGRGTSIIMKLNESNKKGKDKKIKTRTYVDSNSGPFGCKLCNNSNKVAKIRNRYNQVPHLTQDTNGKVTNSQKTPQTRAKRSAPSQQVTTKHT